MNVDRGQGQYPLLIRASLRLEAGLTLYSKSVYVVDRDYSYLSDDRDELADGKVGAVVVSVISGRAKQGQPHGP